MENRKIEIIENLKYSNNKPPRSLKIDSSLFFDLLFHNCKTFREWNLVNQIKLAKELIYV
jgi:hypothetical protein